MSPIVSNLGNFSARVYGWSRASGGWRAVTISAGGSFGGGTVDSIGTYRAQYGVGSIAITSTGAITYQKSVSGGTGARLTCGSLDSSGNYYGIYTYNTNNDLIKFDTTGAINWQGGPNSAATNLLKQAVYPSSGNQYFGYNGVSSGTTYWTKATTAGAHTWTRSLTLGGAWFNYMSVCVDSSENLFGYVNIQQNTPAYLHGIWLGKYNSSGTIQWQQQISVGSQRQLANLSTNSSIATDGSNVFVGHKANATANDNVLAKFTSTGTNSWQRGMVGSVTVYFHTVVADTSGNAYVALADGSNNAYILKYNSSGVLQWQRSLSNMAGFLDNNGSFSIDPLGAWLYIAGTSNIVRLATDGTGTGTIYGSVVYAVSTVITDSAYSANTWGAGTATDASYAGTMGTTPFTVANTAYTLAVQA